jgi:hypothetical protein
MNSPVALALLIITPMMLVCIGFVLGVWYSDVVNKLRNPKPL